MQGCSCWRTGSARCAETGWAASCGAPLGGIVAEDPQCVRGVRSLRDKRGLFGRQSPRPDPAELTDGSAHERLRVRWTVVKGFTVGPGQLAVDVVRREAGDLEGVGQGAVAQ